jgi:hypothetical protein
VAVAGPDQTVDCQSPVTLDGSRSSDPDGDPLTYEWRKAGNLIGSTAIVTTSLPIGTHLVTLKVTDSHAASAEANVNIVVVDRTPPTGSCPAAITVNAGADCQATVPDLLPEVVADDNCTPRSLLSVSQSPTAGMAIGLGQHPVAITVADPSGNSSTCVVQLTVVDATPPTILTTLDPVSVATDSHGQGVVPDVRSGVVATDNCTPAGDLQLSQTPTPETLLPPGQYSITVAVTDAAGNSSSTTVPLLVNDMAAPVIQSLVVSTNILSPPNHRLVPIAVSVQASDNFDPAPVSRILSVTCDEPTAPGDIQITGDLTVLLAASKNSTGSTRTYTITVGCTDASGNKSTGTVVVIVPANNGNANLSSGSVAKGR